MKHTEKLLFKKRALLKPAACTVLALSGLSIAPMASATWDMYMSYSDVAWCNGDGTGYAPIPGFPADTNPFGKLNGQNPKDTWDAWISWSDYLAAFAKDQSKFSPLSNPPNLSNVLETAGLYNIPGQANDRYAVQLNYWNSVANGTINAQAPFGHSAGHSCLFFSDNTYQAKSAFNFSISYPASPSTVNSKEKQFHTDHPNDFPHYVPFTDGPTSGGPTGYISTYKGCSWDGNSCTVGSSIPTGTDSYGNLTVPAETTDANVFPAKLSSLGKIPTTWSIDANTIFGNPFVKDKNQQAWDASWDIWFDKTAHTNEGQAPYGPVRGQNDGLEIMIWMNHNGSYVDAMTNDTPNENQPGLIQPAGHIREQAYINGVVYDVWVGRLNNPYFGYTSGEVLSPNQVQGECTGTQNHSGEGTTCGTEWNVVSFVATKHTGSGPFGSSLIDYRKKSASLDAKDFTNYILGIHSPPKGPNAAPDWTVISSYAPNNRNQLQLQCPSSALHDALDASTAPCLNSSWYLMSIQAGFETWIGGNGLMSTGFSAYAVRSPSSHISISLGPNGQGKDWDKGYCRDIWVTNTDPTFTIQGWTGQFDLPFYPSTITQAWSVNYSQANRTVTVSNVAAWNGVLKPGQSMDVGGFCATK